MTRKWKSTSKTYIPCDICGKKILFTRKNRQRCSNKGKRNWKEPTECQKEATRRLARGEIPTMRRKVRPARSRSVKDGGRDCLKCGERFKPVGKYNRICDKCDVENQRYREVATSYNIAVGYPDY
ncbi:hypothetical protein LCGC14_3108830 [marine sediment metagenome]|uniref:Uncharacterized protein n=1 Tax=marine sediment metagenome TaxID=412755 RepID=A0A0F8WUG8_9ZZZZ